MSSYTETIHKVKKTAWKSISSRIDYRDNNKSLFSFCYAYQHNRCLFSRYLFIFRSCCLTMYVCVCVFFFVRHLSYSFILLCLSFITFPQPKVFDYLTTSKPPFLLHNLHCIDLYCTNVRVSYHSHQIHWRLHFFRASRSINAFYELYVAWFSNRNEIQKTPK